MDDSRIHRNMKVAQQCSWCQRRKTQLLWLMWPSNQRILKDIRASSLRCSLKFFSRPSNSSLPCLPSQPMTARVITELHYKVWFTHILCIVFSCRTSRVTYPTWNWKLNSLFLFVFWCVFWFRWWLFRGWRTILQTYMVTKNCTINWINGQIQVICVLIYANLAS